MQFRSAPGLLRKFPRTFHNFRNISMRFHSITINNARFWSGRLRTRLCTHFGCAHTHTHTRGFSACSRLANARQGTLIERRGGRREGLHYANDIRQNEWLGRAKRQRSRILKKSALRNSTLRAYSSRGEQEVEFRSRVQWPKACIQTNAITVPSRPVLRTMTTLRWLVFFTGTL